MPGILATFISYVGFLFSVNSLMLSKAKVLTKGFLVFPQCDSLSMTKDEGKDDRKFYHVYYKGLLLCECKLAF